MNLCPPDCLCLVQPPCIIWWKSWHPCMAVCLCPSYLISVATPCLECVHGSVHEFMSTLHPMSGPPPMDSYMEIWCTCVSLHVCPIHPGCGPTPCLECVNASVHEFMSTLHPKFGPPLWIVTWKVGCPCVSLHVCRSPFIFVATPCLECVHGSVHEFMST